MTARIMCLNWLRLVGALFRRSSQARFAHAVYRTTQRIKPLVLAPAVLSVLLFAALQPAQAALLNREDIDKLLLGELQGAARLVVGHSDRATHGGDLNHAA